jgi:hypothetical protein
MGALTPIASGRNWQLAIGNWPAEDARRATGNGQRVTDSFWRASGVGRRASGGGRQEAS